MLATVAAIFVVIGWKYVGASSGSSETNYRFAKISRGNLNISTIATGQVKAVDSVEVSSQLSGQVVKLYADFNDRVTSGAPLAQLDDKTYKAVVAESKARLAHARASHQSSLATIAGAKARYEEARQDYQRKSTLIKNGGVSAQVLDKSRADMLAAESALDAAHADEAIQAAAIQEAEAVLLKAQIDLERTVIRSPIDGAVIKRAVEMGQTVAVSMKAPELFTIARDLRHIRVHARVDEADIGRIRAGQHVRFTVASYPDRTFVGRVLDIRRAPKVAQNVVTYTVVISAENPDLALLPGMTAIVHIVTTEKHDAILVPNAALRFEPENGEASSESGEGIDRKSPPPHVWVRARSGTLSRVRIGIGKSDGNVTEVVSGQISEGQTVAIGARSIYKENTLFGIRLGF